MEDILKKTLLIQTLNPKHIFIVQPLETITLFPNLQPPRFATQKEAMVQVFMQQQVINVEQTI